LSIKKADHSLYDAVNKPDYECQRRKQNQWWIRKKRVRKIGVYLVVYRAHKCMRKSSTQHDNDDNTEKAPPESLDLPGEVRVYPGSFCLRAFDVSHDQGGNKRNENEERSALQDIANEGSGP